MNTEKDIVLIIGGGGMSGIFSAGVLKSLEDDAIINRVHSVYAVSVGACTGARFLARQSELGGRTFYTRFNNDKFIKGSFVKYFFQVLRHKYFPSAKIDDVLDFDYFSEILLSSEDKIDMAKVESSGIPFYVKVFNKNKIIHQYLRVREPHAYEKVIASASMTPLTSKPIFIDDEELFDGDTIPSNIETDIVGQNPDKLVVKIENSKNSFFGDFNPFVLVVIYTLLRSMHGAQTANLYFKGFFKRPFWRRNLGRYGNVTLIRNDIYVSSFSKDTNLLRAAYSEGLEKGSELHIQLTAST